MPFENSPFRNAGRNALRMISPARPSGRTGSGPYPTSIRTCRSFGATRMRTPLSPRTARSPERSRRRSALRPRSVLIRGPSRYGHPEWRQNRTANRRSANRTVALIVHLRAHGSPGRRSPVRSWLARVVILVAPLGVAALLALPVITAGSRLASRRERDAPQHLSVAGRSQHRKVLVRG